MRSSTHTHQTCDSAYSARYGRPSAVPRLWLAAAIVSLASCTVVDGGEKTQLLWQDYCAVGEDMDTPGSAPLRDWPTPSERCIVGARNPSTILVTTTDFSSGALTLARIATREVIADIALGSSDAIPFYLQERVFVVHRFGFDYIDVLQPKNRFRSIAQHPITTAQPASANPHSLALRRDGVGFVSLYGAAQIQIFDFNRPSNQGFIGNIDMSPFATPLSDNSRTRLSVSFSCDDILYTTIQRLDPQFSAVDDELLAAVDMNRCAAYDDAIPLRGKSAKQVRLDPRDDSGRTILLLSSGLEIINLAGPAPQSRWLVDQALFAARKISHLHLQAFAVHRPTGASNATLYFAAYEGEASVDADVDAAFYGDVTIWRTPLAAPSTLERVLGGFNAVERTLEIVGDQLWIGDTSRGGAGLRVFDLSQDPPTELAGPLNTGLPPYSMITIP